MRYDRPLPRYTSYPTVPAWHHDPTQARDRIVAAIVPSSSTRAIALYVHVPFCPSLCRYCACNRLITKDTALVDRYLDAVECELNSIAMRIGKVAIRWLHWGGGTPNSLSAAQIARLFRMVATRFSLADDAEISIEVDPRLASRGQIALIAAMGFNRISFGVQDIQEATQRAINRLQTLEQTQMAVQWAREFEIAGVNIDLIYGLPMQTRASFALTIAQVLTMKPNRLAAYAYAHVPWVNRAQRAYENALPNRLEKFGMIMDSVKTFVAAGYRHIGIDHFAAAGDALAEADLRNDVNRTFMGYTPGRTEALVGVGSSAISASQDAFAQNQPDVRRYIENVADDSVASRGCVLAPDDIARRAIIESIMTRGRVSVSEAIPLLVESAALTPFETDGIVRFQDDEIILTPVGRLFARNVASCFDAYLSSLHGRHASAV
ncbi:MAG TPA: oxygen-independent coproporphyrinogen III oxidase [Candidatus Eremiobacteraceae bacterium]